MEFMDTSLENFYSMMHKEEKLSCDSIDRLLLRIIHDVRKYNIINFENI